MIHIKSSDTHNISELINLKSLPVGIKIYKLKYTLMPVYRLIKRELHLEFDLECLHKLCTKAVRVITQFVR